MGIFTRRVCADLACWGASDAVVGAAWRRLSSYSGGAWLYGWISVAFVVFFTAALNAGANQFVRLDYNLTLSSRSRNAVFIELFDDRPLTRDNFMQYVNGGHYDGSIMHRLAKNFVIQGGGFYQEFIDEPAPLTVSLDPNAKVDLDGNLATPNPTVMNEYGNSPTRSNVTGTIAMARIGGQPNSATNQWFVNLNNNTGLDSVDGGFTVFATVLADGMNLFNAFNSLSIANLNPDVNDDGVRDAGPFFNSATDGVPYLVGISGDLLVVLEKARRVDYLGAGVTTNVPAGGLTFSDRDAFIDTGTMFTGTGSLGIASGRTLGVREGTSLTRTLVNHGTLAPGLQLGSITVQSYEQHSDGTLDIQLRGTTPDTLHDRLVVTNNAFLSGKLDVSLLSGFLPTAGNSFTLLTAGTIIGNFTSVDLPLLNAGLVWDLNRTLTAFTLSVASADFNRNGVVDAADYVLWRKTRNTTVTPFSGADGTGDGIVNEADLAIWRSNFGNLQGTTGGGGGLAVGGVPEPSGSFLALIAGLAVAGNRRLALARRRRQAA
ncbi:MAG: peptidylprolyl isomerase [Pirellulales bacterium]